MEKQKFKAEKKLKVNKILFKISDIIKLIIVFSDKF